MVEDHRPIQDFVIFRLLDEHYGLPLQNVSEIVRMVAITTVPKSPDWLSGVINVRGRVVPVVDLSTRLGLPFRAPQLNTPIVIVQVKERFVGFIVDQADEVVSLSPELITPPDELTIKARPVKAFARQGDQLIVILDPPRLTAGTERFSSETAPRGKDELTKSTT
ncbi:MAG: chemotaxis protein CheW [Chloroflexi bacterium]|nr:chemotaxis protein CheW [Anaerolineaceae bacterium]NMB90883.1 chemotaxis protein CheW [Chloroflexota bacterium]